MVEKVGNVVREHGFVDKIQPEQFPPLFKEQTEVMLNTKRVGKILGSILKSRE